MPINSTSNFEVNELTSTDLAQTPDCTITTKSLASTEPTTKVTSHPQSSPPNSALSPDPIPLSAFSASSPWPHHPNFNARSTASGNQVLITTNYALSYEWGTRYLRGRSKLTTCLSHCAGTFGSSCSCCALVRHTLESYCSMTPSVSIRRMLWNAAPRFSSWPQSISAPSQCVCGWGWPRRGVKAR